MTSYALWTTNGLNLAATAVQTAGANAAVTYVALSTGCGTLASSLTIGTVYTSLSLTGTLPANLASGQTLILTDGVNSQQVVTSASVSVGASSIPVVGFAASASFAASVTGIAPLPQASDVALYNESVRVAILASGAGAGAGESSISGYCDGTQPSNVYVLVGYFGGASATSSTGTGTLMIEDIQFWNHTINTDSNMYQADATI
jgi:hypothetical protein